jgi:hypothetical protein
MKQRSAISQYLADIGSKGGKITGVKKGFAALTPEGRQGRHPHRPSYWLPRNQALCLMP